MSRLDFGPKQKEVKITEIAKGLGHFKPKPGKPISFGRLNEALKKSGYRLESARVRISGVVEQRGHDWMLREPASGQVFVLRGGDGSHKAGETVAVSGAWTTEPAGEVISLAGK